MYSSSPEYVLLKSYEEAKKRLSSFIELSRRTSERRSRDANKRSELCHQVSRRNGVKMSCLETYKTEPLLLTIREAMRRYGFSEPSGFRKFCRHLAIPSPDQAPFPVMHIAKMDECWIARNLPSLKLSRKQYKAMVLATGQDLRRAVRNNFRCEIEDLIKQAPTDFRTHPIVQDYLDQITSDKTP